jgi:hypothetical protein
MCSRLSQLPVVVLLEYTVGAAQRWDFAFMENDSTPVVVF